MTAVAPTHAGGGQLPDEPAAVLAYLTSLGSDAVLIVDSARTLVWASPNAAWLLAPPRPLDGAEPSPPLPGSPLNQLLDEPKAADLVSRVLETGAVARAELRHDHSRRVLMAVGAPLRPAGAGFQVLLILTDITHEQRLSDATRELISNLSHDLRTPLASLRLMAETLTGEARDDPEATKLFASRIATEAERLHGLVSGILDLSRLEAGVDQVQIQVVELRALTNKAVDGMRPMAKQRGLGLSVRGGPSMALADPARLERALSNVIDNALKFTPPPGSVTVTVASARGNPGISVRDNGAGIPVSQLPRIFDRFYTGDRSRTGRSTGLGLTIAKQAVELQGGEIEVSSTPGQGTLVRIALRRP
jgi:two-component system phosphate regulon sensor histidine kinase PhoR